MTIAAPRVFLNGFADIGYFGHLKGDNPFWVKESEESVYLERYHLLNFNRTFPAAPLVLYTGPMEVEVQHEDRAVGHVSKTVESPGSLWRAKTKGAQRDYQFRYLSVVRAGMHALSEHYKKTTSPLATATKAQRRLIWEQYFDQDPKFTTGILYPHVQTGFDLYGIYKLGGDRQPLRLKLRKFIKDVYMPDYQQFDVALFCQCFYLSIETHSM
ncbi:hypothetical protein SLS58_011318 [Diplodia intermedia]|uniref:Uncharacterized protein n=1 Tax=Diplodia intermedia TaxID=856260 RepID=A0ABR3T0B1_9PEZI